MSWLNDPNEQSNPNGPGGIKPSYECTDFCDYTNPNYCWVEHDGLCDARRCFIFNS